MLGDAKRIAVIGCSGSGKSTLARNIVAATGLPLIHLDREHWRPGWREPDKAEWRAAHTELIARPKWVIDGNYSGTLADRLERAETVVLLDLPSWLCLIRVLKRVISHRGRERADMAEGCPEHVNLAFLAYVATFRRRQRPRLIGKLRGFRGTVIQLRSAEDVSRFEALL